MINYKAQPDSPPANQQVSPQPPAIQQTNPELAEDNPSSSSQQEFWRRKTCFQDGWATPEKFDGWMQTEAAGPCPHSPPVKAAPHPQGGHHLNPHHLSVIPHRCNRDNSPNMLYQIIAFNLSNYEQDFADVTFTLNEEGAT